jgi:hypothetical protein
MGVCHQRCLHGKRRQSSSRHHREPYSNQKSPMNQAHPTPQRSISSRKLCATETNPTFNDQLSAMHVAGSAGLNLRFSLKQTKTGAFPF